MAALHVLRLVLLHPNAHNREVRHPENALLIQGRSGVPLPHLVVLLAFLDPIIVNLHDCL